MEKIISIILAVLISMIPAYAFSATEVELAKLHKYAVRIGRATGCELNTKNARASVDRWMNRTFKDPAERSELHKIYSETIKTEALAQREAHTSDTCFDIRGALSVYEWP